MNGFNPRSIVASSAIACLALVAISCGSSGIQGTYTNATGLVTLELKSGGQALFTAMGQNLTCKYQEGSGKVMLICPGQDALELTLHDDGSLTPVGTFIGTMKKSKS